MFHMHAHMSIYAYASMHGMMWMGSASHMYACACGVLPEIPVLLSGCATCTWPHVGGVPRRLPGICLGFLCRGAAWVPAACAHMHHTWLPAIPVSLLGGASGGCLWDSCLGAPHAHSMHRTWGGACWVGLVPHGLWIMHACVPHVCVHTHARTH